METVNLRISTTKLTVGSPNDHPGRIEDSEVGNVPKKRTVKYGSVPLVKDFKD